MQPRTIMIHPQLFIGATVGAVVCGLVVISLSVFLTTPDRGLMEKGLLVCARDQPIYLTRAGEYLHLKCNGHRDEPTNK